MRNFIAQQVIFLGITTLLFNVSCQDEKKENKQDAQTEWEEKSPKEKWDYTGVYQVTLPCVDCSGIIVKLHLNEDGSYRIVKNYNGNDDTPGEIKTETGKYQWSENDSLIILNNQKFRISDNVISWKDPEIARIKKDSSKTYSFRMISKDSIIN